MLCNNYPEKLDELQQELPDHYPHHINKEKRKVEQQSRESGTFISGEMTKAAEAEHQKALKATISSALKKRTLNFRYGTNKISRIETTHPDKFGQTRSVKLQSTPATADVQAQTDPVIIIDTPLVINEGTNRLKQCLEHCRTESKQ